MSNRPFKIAGLEASLETTSSAYAFLYYCSLCDELLVLSRSPIQANRVLLIFNGICPACGLELDQVLKCEQVKASSEIRLLVNPRCENKSALFESQLSLSTNPMIVRAAKLPCETKAAVTSGLDALDSLVILRLGQFAILEGSSLCRSLSEMFCVRAQLPSPSGLDTDIVFIDGGNSFDPYLISDYAIEQGIDSKQALRRIHLSRAFTWFQLSTLLKEKLPETLDKYDSKFAVISEITQLYSDSNIEEEKEAFSIFNRSIAFLSILAEKKQAIILAVASHLKNRGFEDSLTSRAHVVVNIEENDGYARMTLCKHPFLPERRAKLTVITNESLEHFLGD